MKRLVHLALALTLVGGGFAPSAFASEGDTPVLQPVTESPQPVDTKPIRKEKETTGYIKATGTIVDIEEKYDAPALVVETSPDVISIFPLTDETKFLFDRKGNPIERDDLEVGMDVELYYDRHLAYLMIYPAVIVPNIVILGDESDGFVKVGNFDDDFISLDRELKLHIGEKTMIVAENGEAVDVEAAKGKELLVFYDIVMESDPMQTEPTKIVVLPPHEHDNESGEGAEDPLRERIDAIIANDHYQKGSQKMIPLRKVLEALGYDVQWDQATNTVTASLYNRTFQITIGKKEFRDSDRVHALQTAPELKNDRTYVSDDFLAFLKDMNGKTGMTHPGFLFWDWAGIWSRIRKSVS